MAKKSKCDRTFCIRATKALQRVAGSIPYQPAWVISIPSAPIKGESIPPEDMDLLLAIIKMALIDLVKFKDQITPEDWSRGMRELADHMSQHTEGRQPPQCQPK